MTAPWVHKHKSVTVQIDRDRLSGALTPTVPHINSVADQAADEARRVLPNQSMRRFIGVKHAGSRSGGNKGMWQLKLRGRRYGSGTGDRLMRGVEVPVALVTNNSDFALVWEYGAAPVRALNLVRKQSKAKVKLKGRVADRGATREELVRQYQPLTLAAQRVGARAVIRARNVKGNT
jgi:hypothetical protein